MRSETPTDPTYGYTAHLPAVSFEDARSRITDALKHQGFGILTEIDVKTTLKTKLNLDFRRYVILGACNPQLAHQALEAELGIGLLLPCNVCVWEEDGGSVVSITRPEAAGISTRCAGMVLIAAALDAPGPQPPCRR